MPSRRNWRLPGEEGPSHTEASSRKNIQDAALRAKTFASNLMSILEPTHFHPHKKAKRRNLVSLLMAREIGSLPGSTENPSSHLFECLQTSSNREYVPFERVQMRGRGTFDSRMVWESSRPELLDIDTFGTKKLEGIQEGERILTTLLVDVIGHSSGQPSHTINWMLLLSTSTSQFDRRQSLYIFDYKTAELLYRFRLPAETHKFIKIGWNRESENVYILGHKRPRHIDDVEDGSRRAPFYERIPCIAVIELLPVRLKCLFEVDPNLFMNAYGALLEEDKLITFCKQPYRVAMFSFPHLYSQYCHRIYAPFELSRGEQIIEMNMIIRGKQPPISIINGNLNCLHVGGISSHFLGEPADRKKPFILQHIGSNKPVKFVSNGFKMMGPFEGVPPQMEVEFAHMMPLQDDSRRVLRFEGRQLACYDIVDVEDGKSEVSMERLWATCLLPAESESMRYTDSSWVGSQCPSSGRLPASLQVSRYGRIIQPTFDTLMDLDADKMIRISGLVYDSTNFITILAFYNVSHWQIRPLLESSSLAGFPTHAPTHNRYLDSIDWLGFAIILNSDSGQIVKINPLLQQGHETTINLPSTVTNLPPSNPNAHRTIDLVDELLVLTSIDEQTTSIDIYRLAEPKQTQWVSDFEKAKSRFVRSTLSNKERRKLRRQDKEKQKQLEAKEEKQAEESVNSEERNERSQEASTSEQATQPMRRSKRKRNGDDSEDEYLPPGESRHKNKQQHFTGSS